MIFLLHCCFSNVLSNSTSCFMDIVNHLCFHSVYGVWPVTIFVPREATRNNGFANEYGKNKLSIWGNSLLLHYLAPTWRPHTSVSPVFSTVICGWIYAGIGRDSSLALCRPKKVTYQEEEEPHITNLLNKNKSPQKTSWNLRPVKSELLHVPVLSSVVKHSESDDWWACKTKINGAEHRVGIN